MKLRTAVIGVGGYGRAHYGVLAALARQGALTLAAVVIRDIAKAADIMKELEELNCRIYPSEDLLYRNEGDSLDLVCVPTGIASHRSMVEKALAHGANVLVEKPAAGSVADVHSMMEAEQRSRGFVAVGFQHMYAREVHRLKRLLESGELGALRTISAMGLWPRGDAYYRRNRWAGNLYGEQGEAIFDSPLNNAFAHYLNLALFWAGNDFEHSTRIMRMQAELYRVRPEIDSFDNGMVRMETENGVKILTLFSHTGSCDIEPRMRLECEKGTIYWQNNGPWRVEDTEGNVLDSGISQHPHQQMFMDVIDRIHNPKRFVFSLKNAGEHTACIENLHRHFPIRLLERRFWECRNPEGRFMISGIEDILKRGFEQKNLPDELGAVWSISSSMIELS